MTWEEPIFADNVKIKHVMASKLPGNVLGLGKHDVLYEADIRSIPAVEVLAATQVRRTDEGHSALNDYVAQLVDGVVDAPGGVDHGMVDAQAMRNHARWTRSACFRKPRV